MLGCQKRPSTCQKRPSVCLDVTLCFHVTHCFHVDSRAADLHVSGNFRAQASYTFIITFLCYTTFLYCSACPWCAILCPWHPRLYYTSFTTCSLLHVLYYTPFTTLLYYTAAILCPWQPRSGATLLTTLAKKGVCVKTRMCVCMCVCVCVSSTDPDNLRIHDTWSELD